LKTKDGHSLADLVVAPPEARSCLSMSRIFWRGLAVQAGVALENARYHERNLGETRVQRDLEAARLIQRSLLPQQNARLRATRSPCARRCAAGWAATTRMDIVDFPGRQQIMTVADVAGKGLRICIRNRVSLPAFRAIAAADVPLSRTCRA
jgi:hypothetical protein